MWPSGLYVFKAFLVQNGRVEAWCDLGHSENCLLVRAGILIISCGSKPLGKIALADVGGSRESCHPSIL